jgi:hypothetical protein
MPLYRPVLNAIKLFKLPCSKLGRLTSAQENVHKLVYFTALVIANGCDWKVSQIVEHYFLT